MVRSEEPVRICTEVSMHELDVHVGDRVYRGQRETYVLAGSSGEGDAVHRTWRASIVVLLVLIEESNTAMPSEL